jgi:hypothetical protein
MGERQRMGRCGLNSSGSGQRLVEGSVERGNDSLGTIRGGNCFTSKVIISLSAPRGSF